MSLVKIQGAVPAARVRVGLVLLACFGFRVSQLLLLTNKNLEGIRDGRNTTVEAVKNKDGRELNLVHSSEMAGWIDLVKEDINVLLLQAEGNFLPFKVTREHMTLPTGEGD